MQVPRYSLLGVMVLAVILGIGSVVALLAPYSSYGRIVQNLVSPIWIWGNNILADWSAQNSTYTFYKVDLWVRSGMTFGIAIASLVAIGILAWRNGRTYCNTICPVGTVLGVLSRYSIFKPFIDTSKCNGCGLCAHNCKASCIDSKKHEIDYSRCVVCMDCIGKCHKGAISYSCRKVESCVSDDKLVGKADHSRRNFLASALAIGTTTILHAEEKVVDGGLAVIADKKIPLRKTPVVPPGAQGIKHLTRHCTGCQLCMATCPNGVLRPSTDLETLMQPRSSYERGYCRPECTKCSEVCPAGAIIRLDQAEKSSVQIGHAVWVKENCVPLTDGVECGNCARHCPAGAIQMIPSDVNDSNSPKIPMIDTERCIGCGACENLCPARPFSAIYVEGHERHRIV